LAMNSSKRIRGVRTRPDVETANGAPSVETGQAAGLRMGEATIGAMAWR
jgi:hypothetical protein